MNSFLGFNFKSNKRYQNAWKILGNLFEIPDMLIENKIPIKL